MDSRYPDELIEEVKQEQKTRSELAVEALQWFLDDTVGQLFPRGDVVDRLSNELDITNRQANTAISDTVGDIVDPVQQIVKGNKKYVGIIDYKIFNDEGAYGYVDFDDRKGGRKRVVCARCVEEHKYDENITHATQGEGSSNKDATWQRLLNQVTGHYADNHIKPPSDIEPGASLVSGTTISGNTAFHSGNESNIDHNNLSNRTHSGDDLSPSSVSSNTLEATGSITDSQGNTITEFGEIGGSVKYHQSSTPSNPSTGDIWFDTELDILRIYNGSVWESDSSIRTLDEATSFVESDVSVETTDTELFGKGATTTRPDDNQSADTEGFSDRKIGFQINPNRDLNGLVGTVSSGSGRFTQIYVIKNSNDKLLKSKTVPSTTGGEEIPIEVPLERGENYKFVVDDNGGIYDYGNNFNSSPPYSGTALDIVRTIAVNNPPIWKGISPLEPTEVRLARGKTTGQTTVTFSDGNTQAYDAVTFQSNEPSSGSDTSSVTCDVIDGNGNTLKSNIPENQSTYLYNIDESKELQLRFDYSADSSSLQPAITYTALSYIR